MEKTIYICSVSKKTYSIAFKEDTVKYYSDHGLTLTKSAVYGNLRDFITGYYKVLREESGDVIDYYSFSKQDLDDRIDKLKVIYEKEQKKKVDEIIDNINWEERRFQYIAIANQYMREDEIESTIDSLYPIATKFVEAYKEKYRKELLNG